MIGELTPAEWSQFVLAVFLFFGPGCLLQWLLPDDNRYNLTHRVIFAICFSISFWIVLFNWFKLLNIHISPVFAFVVSILSWAAAGAVGVKRNLKALLNNSSKVEQLVLWAIVLVVVLYNFYGFRDAVVGLGSDSFHHTLIAELIHDQGIIPDNYQPATDKLVSFTYHFGFHALIAVFGWLSNLPIRLLIILSGPLLIGLSMLTVSLFVETFFRARGSGIIAALIVGVICVFPTYILNWGRYTQFTGMAVLPVFLLMFLNSLSERACWKQLALSGLLASSIALAHYRVVVYIAVGLAIYFILYGFMCRKEKQVLVQSLFTILGVGLAAFLFSFPWLIHLIMAKQTGYPFFLFSNIASSYYSIRRFGPVVLGYHTNNVLFGAAALSFVLAVYKKNWKVIWLYLWVLALFIISLINLTRGFIDTVSVVISFYIPLSIAVGWAISQIIHRFLRFEKFLFPLIGVLGLGVFAVIKTPPILVETAYVKEADLEAAQWVKENISGSAYFMVNVFNFGFSEDFIIGPDAGYWLPLLAERNSVTLPMVYMTEQFKEPDTITYLKRINGLKGDLATPDGLSVLANEGVTHVFIGEQGGNIDAQKLLSSENFDLEYQNKDVYIFRIDYEK